jgi:hypothetical protein
VIDFLKRAWEWIAFALGLLLSYIALRSGSAPNPPTRPKGLGEAGQEAEARQQEAEAKKREAKQRLQRLRQQQEDLEDTNPPDPEEMTGQEVQRWYDENFG